MRLAMVMNSTEKSKRVYCPPEKRQHGHSWRGRDDVLSTGREHRETFTRGTRLGRRERKPFWFEGISYHHMIALRVVAVVAQLLHIKG